MDKEEQIDKINDCVNTAVAIMNMTDDDHVSEMAAYIADQLISMKLQINTPQQP